MHFGGKENLFFIFQVMMLRVSGLFGRKAGSRGTDRPFRLCGMGVCCRPSWLKEGT